ATGDLTKRKLIPSLYNLAVSGLLPDAFAVVGVGRSPLSDEEFRQRMAEDLGHFAEKPLDEGKVAWLRERLRYLSGDLEDGETFGRLAGLLAEIDGERGTGGSYLYYLAVPPRFFGD